MPVLGGLVRHGSVHNGGVDDAADDAYYARKDRHQQQPSERVGAVDEVPYASNVAPWHTIKVSTLFGMPIRSLSAVTVYPFLP